MREKSVLIDHVMENLILIFIDSLIYEGEEYVGFLDYRRRRIM